MEYENKFVNRIYVSELEIEKQLIKIDEGIALALMPNDIWYN